MASRKASLVRALRTAPSTSFRISSSGSDSGPAVLGRLRNDPEDWRFLSLHCLIPPLKDIVSSSCGEAARPRAVFNHRWKNVSSALPIHFPFTDNCVSVLVATQLKIPYELDDVIRLSVYFFCRVFFREVPEWGNNNTKSTKSTKSWAAPSGAWGAEVYFGMR